MEAISNTAYPVTPQTQTSHLRSSRYSKANPTTEQTTRSLHQAESQHPPLSAPASQESFLSYQSTGSSAGPRLESSSSNVSQLTSYTDLMSPTSSAPERIYDNQYTTSKPGMARVRTPDECGQTNDMYAVASPMSVTSPAATNGTKRTASGHVKNAPSLPSTPMAAESSSGRPRADSISSTSSRAGELALNLKTRLGYAMAKVQNGWEHKNIHEVEQLAAHRLHSHRHSMSHVDYSRRPLSAGLSNGTAGLSMHEDHGHHTNHSTACPPSKRHSGVYASQATSSQTVLASAPRLQPAPDLRPTTSQRYEHTVASSQTSNHSGNAMSPPRTPVNGNTRRPPTIRTELQTAEAERDALQALFQLGSPHTSQFSRQQNSQASSLQASPLRSEFPTPRRVTFARSESDSSSHLSVSDNGMPDGKEI
ncbi:hypothetical protein LTR37_014170 [Vermiconidia calcicola]|uniref:Uncharacterized protein n=1 Tax=Vermiconidia calcicola TaxID=1690605 RepID=A0ACC3MU71_9PEZI|nr:hypothetical protein LTR37_014170 [Vermiconidia calcicola]